jgi:NADPH:quinone reductase-like Zn-dependent oxidoreductase
MKAVICTGFGGPEVFSLKEVSKPVPKDNEMLIKIHATTVTGSDVILRRNNSKKYWLIMHLLFGFTKPRSPIFGFILAGEVESAGKDIKHFKVGDKVFGATLKTNHNMRLGTYAEYKCLPEDSQITLMPKGASYEEAAALPYGYSLALGFLKQGGIEREKNVLIYGASGTIGTAAVQLAKCYGARVTGVCSTANVPLVTSLGADNVKDYTKQDVSASGESFDLILDTVPHGMIDRKELKKRCKKLLAPGGKYVSIDDKADPFKKETFDFIKELFEAGSIKPVIGKTYPLEHIADAHRYVDSSHKRGNVVIIV